MMTHLDRKIRFSKSMEKKKAKKKERAPESFLRNVSLTHLYFSDQKDSPSAEVDKVDYLLLFCSTSDFNSSTSIGKKKRQPTCQADHH